MKKLGLLLVLFTIGCGTVLVRDNAPATIDVGYKRVETMICDRWDVGENGCVYDEGRLSGDLRIRRVLQGNIAIVGSGCMVDYSFNYSSEKDQWISLDLVDLVGEQIKKPCVLTIYQRLNFPTQDKAPFQIHGIYGSVLLGVCPAETECSFSAEQRKLNWSTSLWSVQEPQSGAYALRGCGEEIIAPVAYSGGLEIDLDALWPGGYPETGRTGCTFILGVVGEDGTKLKQFRRVWLYKSENVVLDLPIIKRSGKKMEFVGDKSVSLVTVNGTKYYQSRKGKWKPRAEGDLLHFYTVKGRTLVVFVKEGKIVWSR